MERNQLARNHDIGISPVSLALGDWRPRPTLRVAAHEVPQPRFPVIDAHNHLGSEFAGDWEHAPIDDLLRVMDAAGVETMVDLDGFWGDRLQAALNRTARPYPDRFLVFAGIDYDNIATDERFGETEARRLRASFAMGARGLKIWKLLGLRARDTRGRLIPVDDERLDPLWETAAELHLPVMIHVADPIAFFQPLDRFNERWEMLVGHPDWHFYPPRPYGALEHPGYPSFDEIMEQFAALLCRHPQTVFIGAHVGCCAEDLERVGRMLAACPNFYVDTSARVPELGRQPHTARDFFLRWSDRILFGLDMPAAPELYRVYYRFFETRDEYFALYPDGRSGPGRWGLYGIDLPDDVLRKLYRENALRVLGIR